MNAESSCTASVGTQKNFSGISNTGLKIIAVVSMLMDHIYYMFSYTGLIPEWFPFAGRLAAPLFLFCFVEGFTHTHNRARYFLRIWLLAIPMGLCLFFMRFGGFGVRPDGFYPQNSMMSTFLILFALFQAIEWLCSRDKKKILLGAVLLIFELAWPYMIPFLSAALPSGGMITGVLAYTALPLMNLTGDLSMPVLLCGLALFLTRKHRYLQIAAMVAVEFGWHFCLVFFVMHNQPGFAFSQMFSLYNEWMGGIFAIPLLLCYNGQRGAGYSRFFYAFYPLHVYILYALSWLLMPLLGH